MTQLYNFDLLPVLIALAFLSSVVLWIAIKNYQNLLVMMIVIPLTVFSGWAIYVTIDKLLGYPVLEKILDESLYLHHVEDQEGDWIFVWIFKRGESRPKAIMIPNNDKNKEELGKAQERGTQGIPQMLKGTSPTGQGETLNGEIERYDFIFTPPNGSKDAPPEDDTNIIRNPTGPVKSYSSSALPFVGYTYGNTHWWRIENPTVIIPKPSGK